MGACLSSLVPAGRGLSAFAGSGRGSRSAAPGRPAAQVRCLQVAVCPVLASSLGGDHEGANPTSALGFSTFTGTGQTLEYWKLSPWSACSRNSSVAGGEHSRWRTAQQVAPRHGLGGGSSPQLWPMPGWDRSPGWRARPWRGGVAEAAAGCVSILLDISVPAIHPM